MPDNSIYTQKYRDAALLGAFMGVITFPIEHPLDTAKTLMQANPKSPPWTVISNSRAEFGFKGFYAGAIPKALHAGAKHSSKMTLVLFFPHAYQELLPSGESDAKSSAINILTAASMAAVGVVSNPLERLKVVLMTGNRNEAHRINRFFLQHRGELFKELFRGMGANVAKQFISWESFLVATKKATEWEKERTGNKKLTLGSNLIVSGIVGVVNTSVIMPIDAIKTSMQKNNARNTEGILSTARNIYAQHGIKGLYAGWQPRMVHYMVYALFANTIFQELETPFK